MESLSSNFTVIGALHTGTETGFTGSRFPIQIQCSLACAPHGKQTTHIALLVWISRTAMQHCRTQCEYRSRPCGGKVVFGSGSLIRIGSRFKVPCGEPHSLLTTLSYNGNDHPLKSTRKKYLSNATTVTEWQALIFTGIMV